MNLKLSTIYTRLFNLKQSADHNSPLTGALASVAVLLSKNGAAFAANSGGTGAYAEVGHGVYSLVLSTIDTNTPGDFAIFITATGADPQTIIDQITPTVLNDYNVDASGNVSIASSIKKNAACNGFMFLMTNSTSHAPQTGLAVAAQRSLAGAGFAPCANAVTELANGIYQINFSATDTNANCIMYRFTATGADDKNIFVMTQP